MTKKTKKSPARKSRKKTAVDLETSTDWIHLGKGTLSIRALSDAEKAAYGSTLEEQVASLTQRIATLESFNVRLQELEDAAGGIWVTLDGTRIAVRQMSDNHLKNAIKLLEQRNSGSPMILKMRAEQQRRVNDQAWAKKDGNLSSNVEMDLVMKQVDKLTTSHVNSTVKREAPPAGFTIHPYGGRFQLWENGRYVTNGSYEGCLTLAKVRSQAQGSPTGRLLTEFNGFHLNTNPLGRWFARRGRILLVADSHAEVIELVRKVTS